MHVTAIIAAGGLGRRFGGAQPKQLLSVGGRPILERSVTAFLAHPLVDAVIVALPQTLVDDPPSYLRQTTKPLHVVAGGERRQDSVANAFRAAEVTSDIIVIHDAARPFASAALISRTIEAAAESGAALAAVGSRDTVKLVVRSLGRLGTAPSGVEGRRAPDERDPGQPSLRDVWVNQTLPRETVFLAQTPQAFRRGVLAAALEAAARSPLDATDEATLVERAGRPVRLVEGEASNIKVTTPEDLPIAEAIARSATDRSAEAVAQQGDGRRDVSSERDASKAAEASRASSRDEGSGRASPARTGRAGTGYDLHRLVAGRPLVLGGITIPSALGALGHSDADVVCHAVTDAILGAACLGDIGVHFPDSDPRWKDASSLDLLRRAAAMAAKQGLEVGNVDVTVILEAPKLRDHVEAMRAAVAGAIGVDAARVSIKGKTNEGMDAIGRGEAIAAYAIALIRAI